MINYEIFPAKAFKVVVEEAQSAYFTETLETLFPYDDEETISVMNEIMDNIKKKRKITEAIIRLYYGKSESYASIAKHLNISRNRVSENIERGNKIMVTSAKNIRDQKNSDKALSELKAKPLTVTDETSVHDLYDHGLINSRVRNILINCMNDVIRITDYYFVNKDNSQISRSSKEFDDCECFSEFSNKFGSIDYNVKFIKKLFTVNMVKKYSPNSPIILNTRGLGSGSIYELAKIIGFDIESDNRFKAVVKEANKKLANSNNDAKMDKIIESLRSELVDKGVDNESIDKIVSDINNLIGK